MVCWHDVCMLTVKLGFSVRGEYKSTLEHFYDFCSFFFSRTVNCAIEAESCQPVGSLKRSDCVSPIQFYL